MFKKYLFNTLLIAYVSARVSYAGAAQQVFRQSTNDTVRLSPLFQLSAGLAYSYTLPNLYSNPIFYGGYHTRLTAPLKGIFSLSTEYSVWTNMNGGRFDINGNLSCSKNAFVFAGANRHKWCFTRKGITTEFWGVNLGCGFNQIRYKKMGMFGDLRFSFGQDKHLEKLYITEIMTALGVNYTIIYAARKNTKKKFGIGRKVYRWTRKGGK